MDAGDQGDRVRAGMRSGPFPDGCMVRPVNLFAKERIKAFHNPAQLKTIDEVNRDRYALAANLRKISILQRERTWCAA